MSNGFRLSCNAPSPRASVRRCRPAESWDSIRRLSHVSASGVLSEPTLSQFRYSRGASDFALRIDDVRAGYVLDFELGGLQALQ